METLTENRNLCMENRKASCASMRNVGGDEKDNRKARMKNVNANETNSFSLSANRKLLERS